MSLVVCDSLELQIEMGVLARDEQLFLRAVNSAPAAPLFLHTGIHKSTEGVESNLGLLHCPPPLILFFIRPGKPPSLFFIFLSSQVCKASHPDSLYKQDKNFRSGSSMLQCDLTVPV